MTDLWTPTTAANPAAPKPRACKHPREARRLFDDGIACGRCGKTLDPELLSRGRRNRSRGNAIERQVAAQLGLKRTGQYGGPDDAKGDWLVVQVKSGGGYPTRLDRWLRAMTATADQLRAVVYVETPGPGKKAKRLIVCDFDEFTEWYGR